MIKRNQACVANEARLEMRICNSLLQSIAANDLEYSMVSLCVKLPEYCC